LFAGCRCGARQRAAFVAALALTAAVAWWIDASRWRRIFVLAGFPLSVVASGWSAPALPAWAWLLPLALLLAVYPMQAWRDAPVFPTPARALAGLAAAAPLAAAPGCWMPAAAWAPACARCARVPAGPARGPRMELAAGPGRAGCAAAGGHRRQCGAATSGPPTGRGHDLVYLFQRPESMPRALDKAGRELRAGAWLVSLEFEAAGWRPQRGSTPSKASRCGCTGRRSGAGDFQQPKGHSCLARREVQFDAVASRVAEEQLRLAGLRHLASS
jgi:hypothetical protein